MHSLPELLQQSTAHAWLSIPTAMLLGALHGLEPGHSKTMMAALIIAIRGTVAQAILLGVCAALSHTAVVWVVAIGGQYLGQDFNSEATEPYLQIASAVIVLGVAMWMIWRTRREQQVAAGGGHHQHGADQRQINTGHGVMTLEVFEDGVPPRWRARFESGHRWEAKDVTVVTQRAGGARQAFAFVARDGFLESEREIPEPHEFLARVSLGHGDHIHDYELAFSEHNHGHEHGAPGGLQVAKGGENMDAHQRAHASDIGRRFQDQNVTTGQIAIFGLTGGLIPCPAAITVLLLCLQLKQLTLGIVLVGFFSIGLAITMVAAGVLASLSVRHIRKRWTGFGAFARRVPYASSALMVVIAVYMGVSGWMSLIGGHPPQL